MNECGLRDAVLESLKSLHSDLFEPMLENICVYGGNTLFPNFEERLYL
jgi:Actin and related proteins